MYNTMLICLAQGFTAHRNTEGATSFMVDKLYFPSKAEAQIVRDEYFKRYHSTAKVCDVLQKTWNDDDMLIDFAIISLSIASTRSLISLRRDSPQQRPREDSHHSPRV